MMLMNDFLGGSSVPVEPTNTASQAYAVGDYLQYSGIFCRVTAAIASGDRLIFRTNIVATSLVSEMSELKSSVSSGKSLIAAAVTDKGVPTAATDSFATIKENIDAIDTGYKIYEGSYSRETPALTRPICLSVPSTVLNDVSKIVRIFMYTGDAATSEANYKIISAVVYSVPGTFSFNGTYRYSNNVGQYSMNAYLSIDANGLSITPSNGNYFFLKNYSFTIVYE